MPSVDLPMPPPTLPVHLYSYLWEHLFDVRHPALVRQHSGVVFMDERSDSNGSRRLPGDCRSPLNARRLGRWTIVAAHFAR